MTINNSNLGALNRRIQEDIETRISEELQCEFRLRQEMDNLRSKYQDSVNRLVSLTSVQNAITLLEQGDPFQAKESFRPKLKGTKTRQVYRACRAMKRPFTKKDIARICPDVKHINIILRRLEKRGYLYAVRKTRGRSGHLYVTR